MFQRNAFIKFCLAACFALAIGMPGKVSAEEISFEVDYWKPSVSGEVKATGTDVKLKDDLNLDKKGVPGFILSFKPDDNQKYYLKYAGATFRGNSNLSRSFSMDGGNYSLGDKVSSELKFNYFQIGLRNEKKTPGGTVAVIYSYTHGKLETGITDVTGNFSRNRKSDINSLGLGLGWESNSAGNFKFFVEATPLSICSKGGGFNDYSFGVKGKLSEQLGLTIGYRGVRLGEEKDKYGKVDLKGMYAFLSSSF